MTNAEFAVARLYELLMAMLPRGWRSVDLTIERGEVVRVVDFNFEAHSPATLAPFLGLAESELVAAVNAVVAELAIELGPRWSGSAARFSRAPAVELALLGGDAAVQARVPLADVVIANLVLTDPLFDVLDQARAGFEVAQRAFEERIAGFREWGFDQDSGALAFVLADGRPLQWRGVVVGSWASDDSSWLWGWANESIDARARAATAAIRDAAGGFGLAALRMPQFEATLTFASHLAMLAGGRLGAEGIFGGTHAGGAVFLAAV